MYEESPKFKRAADASCEIINFNFDASQPKWLLYSKVLYCILNAMHQADKDEGRRGTIRAGIEVSSG